MRYAFHLIEQVIKGKTVAVIRRSQFAERLTRGIELAMAPANSWQVSQDADGRLRWWESSLS